MLVPHEMLSDRILGATATIASESAIAHVERGALLTTKHMEGTCWASLVGIWETCQRGGGGGRAGRLTRPDRSV